MVIEIKIKNYDQIQRSLRKFPHKMSDELNDAIRRSIIAIQQEAKENVTRNKSNYTGFLRGHISVRFGNLWGMVSSDARYGIFVETGTRPHWPPRAPIEKWVRRKIGPVNVKNIAFLVRRKISRFGTKPRPYMRPAVEKLEHEINKNFEKAVNQALKKICADLALKQP